jgi:uncharacterized membrane protein YesL
MRLTIRLGELVLLNVCFLLCCLPIFTIGAAWTALYSVCFHFDTPQEKKPVRTFFTAFRQNLMQGSLLWIVKTVSSLAVLYLVFLFFRSDGISRYGLYPCGVLFLVCQMVGGYLFPLLSLFDNTTRGTLKNAVILSLSYLPNSFFVVIVNLAPAILLLLDLELFLRLSIFLIFLYFSAAAYINTFLLRKVMAPYLPKEEEP